MPLDAKNVVDAEYVDVIEMYIDGHQLRNLQETYTSLQILCTSFGISINWNKSSGLWVASDASPRPNFKWIPDQAMEV